MAEGVPVRWGLGRQPAGQILVRPDRESRKLPARIDNFQAPSSIQFESRWKILPKFCATRREHSMMGKLRWYYRGHSAWVDIRIFSATFL